MADEKGLFISDISGMSDISDDKIKEKSFQIDVYREKFRIIVKGIASEWKSYNDVAYVEVDGRQYIGATEYLLPTNIANSVLIIQKVDEEGDPGFIYIRIFDLIENEYLNKEEILDLIMDSFLQYKYQDKYIVKTKDGVNNSIKLRIFDIDHSNNRDRYLNINEINDILKDILPLDEYEYYLEDLSF